MKHTVHYPNGRLNIHMKITENSKKRLYNTFEIWNVDDEFATTMFNYLVHGLEPGSCFTAILANDFFHAIKSSHPANTVNSLAKLANWITNIAPKESYGSYDAVRYWTMLDADARRFILEEHELVYTEQEEVLLILQGKL